MLAYVSPSFFTNSPSSLSNLNWNTPCPTCFCFTWTSSKCAIWCTSMEYPWLDNMSWSSHEGRAEDAEERWERALVTIGWGVTVPFVPVVDSVAVQVQETAVALLPPPIAATNTDHGPAPTHTRPAPCPATRPATCTRVKEQKEEERERRRARRRTRMMRMKNKRNMYLRSKSQRSLIVYRKRQKRLSRQL